MPRKEKGRNKHQVPTGAKTAGQPKRVPRVGEDVEFWKCHPVWSFSNIDFHAEVGGWIHFQTIHLDELLARFQVWEKMTWKDILAEGRYQNHAISVSQCIKKARERLEFWKLDDLEELLSLRVSSKGRVIGILDREVFRILWWDPDHQICPAPLKYT